jgi:NitT/TauT family transport system permease protein
MNHGMQEIGPLSSDVVDPVALAAEPVGSRPAAGAVRVRQRPALSVLAPAVAALAALAVNRYLPSRQLLPMTWMDGLPAWQHPYPVLLAVLLAGTLLAAAGQWVWRPLRPWVRHYAPLVAGFLVVVCAWEVVTAKMGWMPQPYFPGPDEVLGALISDTVYNAALVLRSGGGLREALRALKDERAILFVSTWDSLLRLVTGYLSGVAAGLVSGVLIGWYARARYWGMPVLKFIGPVPATALVPLVMLMFRGSFAGAAALIAFAVWFPVTMLTASGISNVRLSYLDVARTLGAGRFYLIFRVAVPSALPSIFVGLFMGLGASFLTLIAAETVGVESGLGWYLQWQRGYGDYAKVYAALLLMAVFFSTIMTLLFKVRDRVLKWQKGVIKW